MQKLFQRFPLKTSNVIPPGFSPRIPYENRLSFYQGFVQEFFLNNLKRFCLVFHRKFLKEFLQILLKFIQNFIQKAFLNFYRDYFANTFIDFIRIPRITSEFSAGIALKNVLRIFLKRSFRAVSRFFFNLFFQ